MAAAPVTAPNPPWRRVAAALLLGFVASCGEPRGAADPVLPVDALPASPGSPDRPPRFQDYPAVVIHRGPPAEPDFSTHPPAARVEMAVRKGVAAGPNFAGAYTLVTWRCGSICRTFVLVDARTGRIFPGLDDVPPFEFRSDSRLIAFDAPRPLPGRTRCAGCAAAYYVWTGEALELIPPETWVGSRAPPPASARALTDSLRARERELLVRYSPAVLRPTWDRLVFAARDGARTALIDEATDEALVRIHVLRHHIAVIDRFLVETIEFPEGGGFRLVDGRTAAILEVDGPPVASPDGRRFITTSLDLVAGHRPNRIRIYRVDETGLEIEWEIEPREWGGEDPRWIDDSTIRLERVSLDTAVRPLAERRSVARIAREAGSWVVGEPSAVAR